MQQVNELRQQLQQQTEQILKANTNARQQAARQEAFEKHCEVDVGTLPVLQKPQGDQRAKQSQFLFLLRAWNQSESTAPVIFQDLVEYSDLGTEAPLFVRTALGSAWTKWFPSDPSSDAVVPRQALTIVLNSLEKLKDDLEAEEAAAKEIEQAAIGTYSLMAGTTKKRRANILDVAMAVAPA